MFRDEPFLPEKMGRAPEGRTGTEEEARSIKEIPAGHISLGDSPRLPPPSGPFLTLALI